MNNNFLPYQLKKNAEQNNVLATQLAQIATQANNGSNDYNKIQNALNSAGINGVVRLNQGGSYSVTQSLTIPSNITIDGNGATLTASSSFSLVRLYGSLLTSTLQALTADASIGSSTITVANASGFSVGDDIYIFPNDGSSDSSNNNNVEYNTITAISSNQITLKNPLTDAYTVTKQYSIEKVNFVQNVLIKNVNFVGYNQTSTSLIIDGSFVKNVRFENCTFTNFYRNIINNGVNFQMKECTLTNCNGGLSFSKLKRLKIEKNEISQCTGTGLAVTYFSDFAKISKNDIRTCGSYAIYYNYWNDNGVIEENFITNCTSYGVCHDYDNYNTLIFGNDISNCGNTLFALSSVNTNIGFHKVIGNTFRDSAISALTLEIVCNCIIENNIFRNLNKDNTISAITIDAVNSDNQASYNIISKNIFDNISGYPIKSTNKHKTTTNKIVENTATNCTYGISLYANDANYIIQNNKGLPFGSIGTNNHIYDLIIKSPEFVFNGSNQQTITLVPKADININNAYLVYTEATDSNTGTSLLVGTPASSNQYMNSFTTEVSKSIGSITSLNGNIGSQTIAAGSTVQFRCTGGKTGTGKGVIFLECSFK
jgi:parallel beta-helix repeat protein